VPIRGSTTKADQICPISLAVEVDCEKVRLSEKETIMSGEGGSKGGEMIQGQLG
jgi:hypothetical protein